MVEDDENNHALYRDAFSAAGFEVVILQNADGDFTETVVKEKPDIISMDLMIGRLNAVVQRDGFEAIGALKADARTSKIPVIVLTNFSEPSKVSKAKELKAVDYICLQGQSINQVPSVFKRYVDSPRKFKASHPEFRD